MAFADSPRVWGGGETSYVKIPRPSSGSRGVFRHIWLDPETVYYLDYDSERACSAGPDPRARAYRAHHACRDYRGHRDYSVYRDYARANSHQVDIIDLVKRIKCSST